VLRRLAGARGGLEVIDTHAGAGLYDLGREPARRSGGAKAGVARLLAEAEPPVVFAPLLEAVRACSPPGRLDRYPGSPWLIAHTLRPGWGYTGCELRADDHAELAALLASLPGAPALQALHTDGYGEAARRLAGGSRDTLLLVDPPFEQADDYARVAALIAARPRPARQGALIWTPLKDLETFDSFLGRLEAGRPASLQAVQVRLRPLSDPMRLNGCALVLVDLPDILTEAQAAASWIATTLGEGAGGSFRVERLAGVAT
jgi:23S rRNA (adenine2030-N6)-methyltransferase